MSKQKFKVGDRVMAKDNVHHYKIPAPGKIVGLFRQPVVDGEYDYLVKFDEGHTLWSNPTSLIEKPPVIVITSDGKTTTATLRKGKKVIKTATAICSDKDAFDFSDGARVAFDRLQGRDPFANTGKKPEYYNGKVVCIETRPLLNFTLGKVYNVRDGKIVLDDGFASTETFTSLDHINEMYESKFAELVED